MKYTISKALKMNLGNEYHLKNLKASFEVYKEINKFHPCYSEVELVERDNEYWHEHTKFLLKNDVIDVVIRFDDYRKRYSFYGNWNSYDMKNLSHYQISDIREKFTEPRGVGKLSKKKIADWIEYEESVYLACKIQNEEFEDKVGNFLETLKGENITNYREDNNRGEWSGSIIKNGIEYKFNISDGCISENISIHYTVSSTLNSFKLLSDNKINRENKIRRILNQK